MLRTRLVYEGTRLDLSDQDKAPWWLMSSADEGSIKAVIATLGRPGWNDESAKMMVGVSFRQVRGRWDTTTANAWGTIAAKKFGTIYPASGDHRHDDDDRSAARRSAAPGRWRTTSARSASRCPPRR